MDPVSALDFDKGGGLVTAIAIDDAQGDVLMVAFMNEASLRQTLETGDAVYWSRSKGRLWRKGEESGHTQRVKSVYIDCDGDVVIVNADRAFGISDIVLSGFVRVVTHPKVFRVPSPISDAIRFTDQLLTQPRCVLIRPGPAHWRIFTRLCHDSGVRGNLVPDAFLAALAIESGCEWITTDRDFSRFEDLRWRHPLR